MAVGAARDLRHEHADAPVRPCFELESATSPEADGIRVKARREMFDLLTAEPEPVAIKSLPLPVQIASFEA
jgi:hypothetical protein